MAICKNCGKTLILNKGKCIYCGKAPNGQIHKEVGESIRPILPPVRTFNVNGVSFKMIRVEGGKFYMGITPQKAKEYISKGTDWRKLYPIVSLNTYYIAETVVTQGLWESIMQETDISQLAWKDCMGELMNPSKNKGNDNLPIENIRWFECQEFIDKLNASTKCKFRLPSDAEWEFAARGGNLSRGYEHAGSNNFDEVGWYDSTTKCVKSKRPNELGIYDMSGNVLEWCHDGYYFDSNKASLDYVLLDGFKAPGPRLDCYHFGDDWMRPALPSSIPENEQYHIIRGFYNPQRYNILYREVAHNAMRQSTCNNMGMSIGFRLALSTNQ